MNVRELIEKLSAQDSELMVVIDGYEGGVKEARYVDVETIVLNVNEEWYYGEHEPEDTLEADEYPDHARAQAVRVY